jgi:lysophospholipase L1-like esterase
MSSVSLLIAGLAFAAIVPDRAWSADLALRADLERIARERIYFGHQSVGANLLEGVQELAAEAGVEVRIRRAEHASQVPPGTFGHTFVAENGKPLKKLESFRTALASASVDLALVEFCYVDIGADTDVKALFSRYRETLAELRKAHPRTTFIHETLPLTTAQAGWKALVKRLLGRAPSGTAENARREEYNRLLRAAYAGREPLFDLARVESTAPDGTAVRVAGEGALAPALAPAYTDDGGHLNAQGRRRAARELIAVLAAARQPQP